MPKRMPVRASADAIRRQWLTLFCLGDAAAGLVTLFGPTQSASQQVLRDFVPTQVWGGIVIAAAGLIWLGWSVLGAAGGAFAWGGMGASSFLAILHGDVATWLGPVVFAILTGVHALIITNVLSGLDADREQRQRGQRG